MDKIRVDRQIKRIEVNDNGEYIELNLGDQTFPVRFYEMMERIESQINAYNSKAMELDKQYENATAEEKERAICGFNAEIHEMIKKEVDSFFGPETCHKVFGDIVPGLELYYDFFSQLTQIFENFARERTEKMSKYSLERQGNV